MEFKDHYYYLADGADEEDSPHDAECTPDIRKRMIKNLLYHGARIEFVKQGDIMMICRYFPVPAPVDNPKEATEIIIVTYKNKLIFSFDERDGPEMSFYEEGLGEQVMHVLIKRGLLYYEKEAIAVAEIQN